MGEVKQELEVTREREANYARERAELSTQLAEAQKAKANLECELESHFRSASSSKIAIVLVPFQTKESKV